MAMQYGNGLKAFVIYLLVSQMVSVNRVQKMLRAMIGQCLSEATLLSYILRLHLALAPWEAAAKQTLLSLPALHTDETSLRVQRKNHWIHVYAGGDVTLKCLHRKRGKAAIEDNDIIPRYGGVIIHDCWASYFAYDHCKHGLCGSHLLRELAFIHDSNGYRFAKQMKSLLQRACRKVADSEDKVLSEADYKKLKTQYRRILTQGKKRAARTAKENQRQAWRDSKIRCA